MSLHELKVCTIRIYESCMDDDNTADQVKDY